MLWLVGADGCGAAGRRISNAQPTCHRCAVVVSCNVSRMSSRAFDSRRSSAARTSTIQLAARARRSVPSRRPPCDSFRSGVVASRQVADPVPTLTRVRRQPWEPVLRRPPPVGQHRVAGFRVRTTSPATWRMSSTPRAARTSSNAAVLSWLAVRTEWSRATWRPTAGTRVGRRAMRACGRRTHRRSAGRRRGHCTVTARFFRIPHGDDGCAHRGNVQVLHGQVPQRPQPVVGRRGAGASLLRPRRSPCHPSGPSRPSRPT